jgi:hypothetical protein
VVFGKLLLTLIVAAAVTFLFTAIGAPAQAERVEIKVAKTGEKYRIYEIKTVELESMKTLGYLPLPPDGIDLNEKEILEVFKEKIIEKNLGKKVVIKKFFPFPIIQDSEKITRLLLTENNQWKAVNMSGERFGAPSIFLSLLLLGLTVMVFVAGIDNRVNLNKRKLKELILLYVCNVLVVASLIYNWPSGNAAAQFIWVTDIVFIVLGIFAVILFIKGGVVNSTGGLVILATILIIPSAAGITVAWHYLIYLAVIEVLSLFVGEGVYLWRKRRTVVALPEAGSA